MNTFFSAVSFVLFVSIISLIIKFNVFTATAFTTGIVGQKQITPLQMSEVSSFSKNSLEACERDFVYHWASILPPLKWTDLLNPTQEQRKYKPQSLTSNGKLRGFCYKKDSLGEIFYLSKIEDYPYADFNVGQSDWVAQHSHYEITRGCINCEKEYIDAFGNISLYGETFPHKTTNDLPAIP